MNTHKGILGLAGVIGSIIGITAAIPAFANENYTLATLGIILLVSGLVFLAIFFGE